MRSLRYYHSWSNQFESQKWRLHGPEDEGRLGSTRTTALSQRFGNCQIAAQSLTRLQMLVIVNSRRCILQHIDISQKRIQKGKHNLFCTSFEAKSWIAPPVAVVILVRWHSVDPLINCLCLHLVQAMSSE
jgi:hypothetical protein